MELRSCSSAFLLGAPVVGMALWVPRLAANRHHRYRFEPFTEVIRINQAEFPRKGLSLRLQKRGLAPFARTVLILAAKGPHQELELELASFHPNESTALAEQLATGLALSLTR